MCDDDIKSCPMNQSPSDILNASNETVSVRIATADRLCVASLVQSGTSQRDIVKGHGRAATGVCGFSALCYVLPKILSLWFCARNLVFPVIAPVTSTFDADASADDSSHS